MARSKRSAVKRRRPAPKRKALPAKRKRLPPKVKVDGGRGGAVARREVRVERDLYETPMPTALAICRRLAKLIAPPARIIEPSAGSGNFVEAAKIVWPEAVIMAVDIYESHTQRCFERGAATVVLGRWQDQDVRAFDADLLLGNPPNSEFEDHVAHALDVMRLGAHLAFLQPMTVLASQKRAEGMWAHPPPFGHLHWYAALAERPSFGKNRKGKKGTDQMEYALYVWTKGYVLDPTMKPHVWCRESLLPEYAAEDAAAVEAVEDVSAVEDVEPARSDGQAEPVRIEAVDRWEAPL